MAATALAISFVSQFFPKCCGVKRLSTCREGYLAPASEVPLDLQTLCLAIWNQGDTGMNKGKRCANAFKHDVVTQVVERSSVVSELPERLGAIPNHVTRRRRSFHSRHE